MTPSQPTMPPPDPIAMVLCAIPYSVPVLEGRRKEGRKGGRRCQRVRRKMSTREKV